jgi:CheY-like chemotaxis protein
MTKILLVEDDKSLREIYGVRLLAEGYQIASAGDGEEALAMAVKEHPDLIISDVMMPKISGFDMLDILRSTPETKEVKVIMMTALSSEDQRARGESLGANRYLVKSQVGIEDVVRTVHDVLADAPVAATPASQMFGMPAPSAVATPQPTVAAPITEPVFATPQPMAPPMTPKFPEPTEAPTFVEPQMPVFTPQLSPLATPPIPQPVAQPQTPVEPVMPEPIQVPVQFQAPVQMPQQPVQPMPTAAPSPITPSQMPQPTAPFSTPSPTPLNNRVINPMQESSSIPDINTLISQELNDASITSPTPPQA